MTSSNEHKELADWVPYLEQFENAFDQLSSILPPQQERLFLRLMQALELKVGDPLLPIIVALQVYSEYLKTLSDKFCSTGNTLSKEIPDEIRNAGDDALNKALATYSTIQTQIEQSVDDIKSSVTDVEEIRVKWEKNTKSLLPEFKDAFESAKKEAVEAYQTEIQTKVEAFHRKQQRELESLCKTYFADVFKQVVLWSGTAVTVSLLFVGGTAYWLGTQNGKTAAVQASYQSFQGKSNYEFAKSLMNRADNISRLVKCSNESNAKCTVWIEDPPQASQE